MAKGSPRNRICLASGAQIALAERVKTALDFWYEAEHNGGSEPLDPLLGYRAMMAGYKLEQARDLAQDTRGCSQRLPRDWIALWLCIVPDHPKSEALRHPASRRTACTIGTYAAP